MLIEEMNEFLGTDPVNIHEYIARATKLINKYEESCYFNDQNPNLLLINSWTDTLKQKVFAKKETKKILAQRENAEDKNVFDTLALIISQVETSDKNMALLDSSNIKLSSLSHNTKSLEKELLITQKTIKQSRINEMREIRRVYYSFVLFFSVLFYIVISRFGVIRIGGKLFSLF